MLLVTSGHFQRQISGLANLTSLICEAFWFCCGYSRYLVSQTYMVSKAVLMWRVYANYTSCRFVTRVAPDSSMSYPPPAEHFSLTTSTFTDKILGNSYLLFFTPFLQFKCWLCSTDTSFFVQNGIVLCFMSTSARKQAGLRRRSFILFLFIIRHYKSLVNIESKSSECRQKQQHNLFWLERCYRPCWYML